MNKPELPSAEIGFMQGHNSGAMEMTQEQRSDESATGKRLRSYIERWERLNEEKKAIAEDQKEVLSEAKSDGFDVPTIRALIKLRAKSADKRSEEEMLLETYMSAIGM